MRIVFADFEASGLGVDSFPIELGWAWCEGDHVEARSILIRPTDSWKAGEYPGWSPVAETLHGLSIDRIEREGRSVNEVAKEIALAAADALLSFDTGNKGYDRRWLQQLFDAVSLPMTLNVSSETSETTILKLAEQAGIGDVTWTALERLAPAATHCAAADAARWAWWPIAISLVAKAGLTSLSDLSRGVELARPVVTGIAIRGLNEDADRAARQVCSSSVVERGYRQW